jgi:PHD-finger
VVASSECILLQPILPTAAVCIICNKGDAATSGDSSPPAAVTQSSDLALTLMECNVCWKIVHPQCLRESYPQLKHEGIINKELPNSWECPKCCDSGAPKNAKVFRVTLVATFCFFFCVRLNAKKAVIILALAANLVTAEFSL